MKPSVEQFEQVQGMLQLMGVPVVCQEIVSMSKNVSFCDFCLLKYFCVVNLVKVQAPSEAEATCAILAKNGIVAAAASDDSWS